MRQEKHSLMTAVSLKAPSQGGFLRRNWHLILVSFIGWSLLAAIPTTSAYLGGGAPGLPVWWAMFVKIGGYYYLWGLVTPLLYRLTDSLPYRGRGLLISIPVHLVVLAALSFGFGVIAHQSDWQEWLLGFRAIGYHAMSFFTYALIILCCLATKFYRLSLLRQREATDAKIQSAQLDNQLNLARVDSLRMQMNPHFLFNALNSIAALIESDRRDGAYEATEQLGDLLRRALNLSKADEVSLDEELKFCKAYLAMEKIRFGDRLKVEWQIDESSLHLEVPAFILQPSVENAIKHAVSVSAGTVELVITAQIVNSELILSVCDDGRAKSGFPSTTGLGLANLRERLMLRFGPSATVDSGAREPGYCTSIRIPVGMLTTTAST